MESDTILPAIGLLQAIGPDPSRPDNERLTYPSLAIAVQHKRPLEELLLRTFYTAEEESIRLAAAVRLAEYELIQTANELQRAQSPARQQALSQQFTTASINIFGSPDRTTASYLLEQLLTELCIMQTNYSVDAKLLEMLIQTYAGILERSHPPKEYRLPFDDSTADAAADIVGTFLAHRYGEALAVFDGEPTELIGAQGIAVRFEKALRVLRTQDDFWHEWQVVLTNDSCLSVNADAKRLVVGAHRASVELGELRGLFGHEVLVHAQRAKNGQRLSHEFERGLPGYIDAEEGMGCFVEHALTGLAPLKMYDRYLDIALALGTLDGQPKTRKQLFKLVYARGLVRSQAEGKTESCKDIEREGWAHVNRIFRGTLGNDVVGVFTKDIAYYQGYDKITAFIIDELSAEVAPEELWELLTLGRFDPTRGSHIASLVLQGTV